VGGGINLPRSFLSLPSHPPVTAMATPPAVPQATSNGIVPNGHKLNQHSPISAADSHNSCSEAFKLGNFSVDEARPMKVVVIGAGFSGELGDACGEESLFTPMIQASQQE
jgi:hypothetical protein